MVSLNPFGRLTPLLCGFFLWTGSFGTAAEPNGGNPAPATIPGRVVANKPVADEMSPAQRRDQLIARWLVLLNQNEIAIAHFAASKTENKEVKQFAEMLQKDHSQGLSLLGRFTGRPKEETAGTTPGANNSAPRRGGVEVVAPFVEVTIGGSAPSDDIAAGPGGLNFLAVQRQIGQQCLKNTEREWASKKPHERDMAFVGMQMAMHEHLIAAEEVLRQYASTDLQPIIDDGLKEAHQHFNAARSLIEELTHQERSSK